jgi:hypothetical protein
MNLKATADASERPMFQNEAQNCKVFQNEWQVGTGKYTLLALPLTCPLQLSDHATAETISNHIKEQMFVLCLSLARRVFPANYEMICDDNAGSNIKAEQSLEVEAVDSTRLRTSCDIHTVHGAQGKSYKVIDPFLSGLISYALTQAPGGALNKLHQAVAEVTLHSFSQFDGPRSRPTDPRMIHGNLVLDLLVGSTIVKKVERRFALQELLTSDITLDEIILYKPGPPVDARQWCWKLSRLLLPQRVKIFQRRRWMSSASPLSEAALLDNTHNLFRRSVPRWCVLLKGRVPPPMASWRPTPDSDDEAACAHEDNSSLVPFVQQGVGANGTISVDWTHWNRVQRGTAKKLAESNPGPTLLVARVSLQQQTKLLGEFESISGDSWELQQAFSTITFL